MVSDIWLNSVNFTLPIEFSLFAYLYEVPLIQRCIPIDWQADACRWQQESLIRPHGASGCWPGNISCR